MAPAVILTIFGGEVILQFTYVCQPIGTCRHPDWIPGRGHIVAYFYLTLRTPIGTCRHPDYIRWRGHIVVYIIMSANWHLLSPDYIPGRGHIVGNFYLPFIPYTTTTNYLSNTHYLLHITHNITYTNSHLPSSRLFLGRGHIVVYIIMYTNGHLPSS